MDKVKIVLSTLTIFLLSFLIAFFVLQYAKQSGRDDFFRAARPYEVVIKNARIIDGTGSGIFDAHIGIKDGKIITVSRNLNRGEADIFDATGFTLMPGMVDIPEDTGWVTRDLPGAMARFPYDRIFFSQSDDPLLAGRSLRAVLQEEIYTEEELRSRFTWVVMIAPDGELMHTENTLVSSVYKMSGWRADALELDTGKIAPGYRINAKFYRTKRIEPDEFIRMLNTEVYPEADFLIRGNEITDTITGLKVSKETWSEITENLLHDDPEVQPDSQETEEEER